MELLNLTDEIDLMFVLLRVNGSNLKYVGKLDLIILEL